MDRVRKIIKYLGIETKRSSFKRKPWTKEEITLLEKHYPNCTGKEINKYISHRSYDAISKMYSKLRREKNES